MPAGPPQNWAATARRCETYRCHVPEHDESDAVSAHLDRQDRVFAILISAVALVIVVVGGILVVVGGQ